MFKNLKNIIVKSDATLLELSIYLISSYWGAWLLLPRTSLKLSSVFWSLTYLAPDTCWGFIALVWGVLGIFCLGCVFKYAKLRKILTFTGSLYWVFISIFSFINTPFFVSFPLFSSFGLLSLLCFLKLPKYKFIKAP